METNIDLLLIVVTGLMSAPHCIGMCGGIMSAWTLQSNAPVVPTVLAYNMGRTITYTMVGAFMGMIGSFVDGAGKIVGLQGIANIVGGVFILLWVLYKVSLPISRWTPMQLPVFQDFLQKNKQKTGLASVFISGILLGFLPCGLTYTMHMKAAASGSPWLGALTLFVFGLATLPALACVGFFSHVMGKALRRKVLLIGNVVAILIGILAILRGMAVNGWIPSINPWLW